MRQRQCIGPYDLFSLKYDLDITLQQPTNKPAPPLTKETFDMAVQFVKEFAEKERGRILPERFEDTKAKYVAIWTTLTKTHWNYYRRRKYLPVEYNPDSDSFSAVIPGKGRPAKQHSMIEKLDFRLDVQTTKQLLKYCRTNNVTQSEAIREAITLLLATKGQNN